MSKWKIAIDTGGTFTDCIALDPSGVTHRVKVLSTGRLRGRVQGIEEDGTLLIGQTWNLKKDLLQGYSFEFLNNDNSSVEVVSFNPEKSTMVVSGKLQQFILGNDFEVFTSDEAPILAARMVTESCKNDTLPTMDMRLGSTRGTNALLEQKGTEPILIITEGFGDLSKIGTQQREDLFCLNILKPDPLFEQVIEVKERISSSGDILVALTESEINRVLRKVYQSDNRVVVIVLLNSYKNPVHEKTLLNILKTKGYKYVTASHQLGQVISFLPRIQTSLVNGYLTPVISDYLDNIRNKLDQNSSLKLMTSSGGLVDASAFHPKDSLLSGPAGGVIGASSFAKKSGIEKLLAFDMGGTSTDVSRFAGTFDYIYHTKVGEQTINSPALFIETVAAGGGSICSFDGFKFSVGPESAGAFPGPACYGAGGVLTITDVNLLLGRIYPGSLGIPINLEDAKARLKEMRAEHLSLKDLSDDEMLQGFFDIANEKMAKAIEKISVARGYEPSRYTLLAFGGAGGMHACKIAETLSIDRVCVPYDAGILSAAGIANALIERIIHRQVLRLFDVVITGLPEMLSEMREEADHLLKLEGLKKTDKCTQKVFLYLRFEGQDDPIEVPFKPDTNVSGEFKKAYFELYGHYLENHPIELESVKMIVSEKISEPGKIAETGHRYEPSSYSLHESYDRGEWFETPVYRIDELDEGAEISGPAIVVNQTSTSFIDIGWNCLVNENHDLFFLKGNSERNFGKPDDDRPEQVQLELYTNRFRSVTADMGALLQRTAFSVNIKERLDFSCALLDKRGYLVVNAPHIPVHLGALGLCCRRILETTELKEGDIVVTNHPAYGGSHLPDVTMLAPVYHLGILVGFVANRAHHSEIGGISPGSMPADAILLEEEGVVIPPTYIARESRVDFSDIRFLLTQSKYPTRALGENLADLQASVASIRKGIDLMKQLCSAYGPDKVSHYMHALHQYSNFCIQKKLGEIMHLKVEAIEKLDDGSVLKVRIQEQEGYYVFDFSGTSTQHSRNMNATPAIVNSVVLYVLRLLIDEDIPLNEGILANIDIQLPVSMLNPDFNVDPAKCPAVVGGNVEVSQRLVDTILKAFNIVACSQGTMNNLLFGNDSFGFYETICGGVGAGEGYTGASAVHQHMTNTKITDPEIMEHRYPVRIEKFAIRKRSGGKGKYNGGDGVERQIRFLETVTLTILSQHRNEGPYGINGGKAGKKGEQWLKKSSGERRKLPGICAVKMKAGESILIKTPGGGGFGEG